MAFGADSRYVKIWKVFLPKIQDAKSVFMSVSTSEKNRDDEYENSSWFAVAVGHAFQQWKAGDIKEGEKYSIHGKLSNVRKKDEDGEWVDNYRLTIFDFGKAGEDANKDSSVSEKGKPAEKKTSSKPAKKTQSNEEQDPW